ncbi:hypothetical protein WR25_13672 [Diploscapter pachys]|uniref:Uncharacterized protein n=1 Tax=Diploscapter pachys TaxID=2018661 RepID=A0A2A2L647_9BILA|nr:hypothetical protein WR25_13672 [Diploscapter pachys]
MALLMKKGSTSDSNSEIIPEQSEKERNDEEGWGEAHGKKFNFETKSKQTYPVHSPYYPLEKYEWWWILLTYMDKKEKVRKLVCPVTPCKTLTDETTVSHSLIVNSK